MRFRSTISSRSRALEVPGTRSELRITFDLDETQVPRALKLILLRGVMFRMFLQEIEEAQVTDLPRLPTHTVKNLPIIKRGEPVEVWASISSKESAIRISGTDGMQVTFSIPMMTDPLLVKLLGLREKYIEVYIPEKVSEAVTTTTLTQTANARRQRIQNKRNNPPRQIPPALTSKG